MPMNAGPWFDAATKPLQRAYGLLTTNKVAIPLMAASVLAPVIGSNLASGKQSRKERLGEFAQDRGELADTFNAKQGSTPPDVVGPKSPLDAALTAQHHRDNVHRPDPVAMKSGLDGMQAMMQNSKKNFAKSRGTTSMASLV